MRILHVLHTARCRDHAMATIPMPAPTYHLETAVRVGARGAQYVVLSADDGGDMRIYPTYLPRRRPMRRCELRTEIEDAVSRSLPFTRPLD